MHLDSKCPVNRIDNFLDTQARKLTELLAVSSECDAILQAGDLTNSPTVGNETISLLLTHLRTTKAQLYSVPGQHDLLFRSYENLYSTAMGVLVASGYLSMLRDIPTELSFRVKENPPVYVYGCGWGQPVPYPPKESIHSILVIHASIGDTKLFPTMDLIQAQQFLLEHKYDLILTGDYHYPFHFKIQNKASGRARQIVNTGVLMRRSINESEIVPKVGIYDTKTREIKWKRIMVESNVFRKVEKEEKEDVEAVAFKILENLEHSKTISSDYKESILHFMKANFKSIKKEVRDLIMELLSEAEELSVAKG
jgi:DNA repair exonuclease SbcCD nuclease subunit